MTHLNNRILILAIAAAAGSLLGCGSNVCDRSNKSASEKIGDCGGDQTFNALGPSCSSAQSKCDSKVLDDMASCFEKLPVCQSSDEASWVSKKNDCYAKASGLSDECRTALFGEGGVPGEDAGSGTVDAGPQPDLDGGGALDLVVVADETDFAAAWTRTQPGDPSSWELYSKNALDLGYPIVPVSDPFQYYVTVADAGAGSRRSFFVRGLTSQGAQAFGQPGNIQTDAGTVSCLVNADCALDRVCDLGQCKKLVCNTSAACPAGYVCENINTFTCNRQYNADGGQPQSSDAGPPVDQEPRPGLSEAQEATTGPVTTKFQQVSEFPADEDPDVVGIDSARQVVTVQQNSQIFAHVTENRGQSWRVSAVDPLGQHARVTWNPTSRTIFTCYSAGSSVRVRSSDDMGRSWSANVAEIAIPDPGDGGIAPPVTECAIAPWRDGGAIVAVVMVDHISTFALTKGLGLGAEEVAYRNEDSTAGNLTTVFGVSAPAIATSPDEFIVHVAFTGFRNLTGGGTEQDVYGVYRDPARTGSNYSNRIRISGGSVGSQGQPYDQNRVVIAVEPKTGRALAAYQSVESNSGGALSRSVYVSLFTKNSLNQWGWATGSDLNVYARDNTAGGGTYVVVTDRPATGTLWDAINPSVAMLGNGRAVLAFAAGQVGTPLFPYSVGLSFEQQSAISGGKGWFVVPAQKLANTPVVNLGNTPKRVGPVVSGDAQISSYITYIEGLGAQADTANRPLILVRP
ncbi:MAG: hypothetical protein ACJ790_08730 [Myxococcaceae bacterium]